MLQFSMPEHENGETGGILLGDNGYFNESYSYRQLSILKLLKIGVATEHTFPLVTQSSDLLGCGIADFLVRTPVRGRLWTQIVATTVLTAQLRHSSLQELSYNDSNVLEHQMQQKYKMWRTRGFGVF